MGYWRAFVNIWKEIRYQKRFNKTYLLPYLDELEEKYNGKFSPEQRKKIVNYYGLFITSFLCSSYKRLYGKNLTKEERNRATLFGVLTPVGDDLFDIDNLDIETIRAITFTPNEVKPTTFSSAVAVEIQQFLLSQVPNKEAYKQASADVLNVQAETIQQINKNISHANLERITYTKGAVSVVIYHQCLDDVATDEMFDALFYIGSLYQVGNDLFDLFKDVRDNIYTLVNTCTDFTVFKYQFLARVRLQNKTIMALPYPNRRKREFCIVMNTINARSMVAINQFIRLQKRNDAAINWWEQERKDMITDMQKPLNILRWLYYIYLLPRL